MKWLKAHKEGGLLTSKKHEPGQGFSGKGQSSNAILRPGNTDEDSEHAPAERRQMPWRAASKSRRPPWGFEKIVEDPVPAHHLA